MSPSGVDTLYLCTKLINLCYVIGGYTVVGFLPKVGENHQGQVLGGG